MKNNIIKCKIKYLKVRRECKVIRKTPFFDSEYYLRNYQDVRIADIEPAKHFLEHGWKEGRNPLAHFDTSFYLKNYPDIVQNSKMNYKIYIHDFYTVCPTVNLLNYKFKFCNLPDITECNNCLNKYPTSNPDFTIHQMMIKSSYNIHKGDIRQWHKFWELIFEKADEIIFPSKSAVDLWLKRYSVFLEKTNIYPHDLTYLKNIALKTKTNPNPNHFLQVYIIGDIYEHKGSKIIHQILSLLRANKLNICLNIIGSYKNSNKFENTPYLKLHGRFKHFEIPEKINMMKIDCFLMTSIWPETFSYVTHEMMATGLAIISFNLGAQGDLISKYKKGIVVDKVLASDMFDELNILYRKHILKLFPILNNNLSSKLKKNIEALVDNSISLQLSIAKNEILQNKIVNMYSHCFVQLFIDTGKGFLEETSVRRKIDEPQGIKEFEFDLSNINS